MFLRREGTNEAVDSTFDRLLSFTNQQSMCVDSLWTLHAQYSTCQRSSLMSGAANLVEFDVTAQFYRFIRANRVVVKGECDWCLYLVSLS